MNQFLIADLRFAILELNSASWRASHLTFSSPACLQSATFDKLSAGRGLAHLQRASELRQVVECASPLALCLRRAKQVHEVKAHSIFDSLAG